LLEKTKERINGLMRALILIKEPTRRCLTIGLNGEDTGIRADTREN
jgi:hypothetical protein